MLNAPSFDGKKLDDATVATGMIDALTGLYSHRQFHETLANLAADESVASLVLINVDQMKSFNDEFGHRAGDVVLQQIADVLRAHVRSNDSIARYGGEEFALLLPGQDESHAIFVADRIRMAVELMPLATRRVTVSIGISTVKSSEQANRILIDQAEIALAAAKMQGRNRSKHHTQLHRRAIATVMSNGNANCQDSCSPTPEGCAKCQTVPAATAVATSASLLLAPQDTNADETLRRALVATDFAFTRVGPLFVIADARRRLPELSAALKEKLSPYTRACIRAVYAPGGVISSEQALASFAFAESLSTMIEHSEHEWIRDALSSNWLFSVFHPILNAVTGRVFAQECLIRARDPETGKLFGAGQIIQSSNALNLEHQLDQRARQAAISGGARHVSRDSKLFINFLPNTIYDPEVCLRTTMQAAADNGVEMSRLVFEVVETEKIPDMANLIRILEYYRDRGVGTAVDDMGAGFTSVEYINQLRPDFVKLDRELVVAAEHDAIARSNMDLMIRATHAIGGRVVAEGIETASQHKLCVDTGCDLVQGFLFCKPSCPPAAANFAPITRAAA